MKEAQIFAIRRTVHHKPHRNMGNLRPKWGSSYILCLLVASTVVIVRLQSLCLAKMAWCHYALQRYSKNFNYRNFWCYISAILDKIYLNYARNNDFTLPFREKVVPLQAKKQKYFICQVRYGTIFVYRADEDNYASWFRVMITIQDLYNIVENKISNEIQKSIIRNNFPPQIAERMCSAIDGQEDADHFMRLLNEYNEWMVQQQRQQEALIEFLRQYRS